MSTSMCSGIAVGSASTRISRLTCWTTPPCFAPGDSPRADVDGRLDRLVEPHLVEVDVRQRAAIGCCWYSLSTAWCGVVWPSITTSTIACSPTAGQPRAQLALADMMARAWPLP
jgi:hypothetical protein